MISKSLSTSRRYAALYAEAGPLAEFCQSLFTLLITHADDFGRLPGDVFTIKHLVFPISPRTLDEFNTALAALDQVGLIHRYRANMNDYLEIERFEDHQIGLHKRTQSKLPDRLLFPEVPGSSGNHQESPKSSIPTELNRTELNLTEGKRTKEKGVVSAALNGNGHLPQDDLSEKIGNFSERYPLIYAKVRAGAHYRANPVRDYPNFRELVTGWPLSRLEQMLEVFLHMPKKDANNVPGTPGQFLNMAPECDKRLRENGL